MKERKMKLKTKLIPMLTMGAVASAITPILVSCNGGDNFYHFTDDMKFLLPTSPCAKADEQHATTGYDETEAKNLYLSDLEQDPTIFEQDLRLTLSNDFILPQGSTQIYMNGEAYVSYGDLSVNKDKGTISGSISIKADFKLNSVKKISQKWGGEDIYVYLEECNINFYDVSPFVIANGDTWSVGIGGGLFFGQNDSQGKIEMKINGIISVESIFVTFGSYEKTFEMPFPEISLDGGITSDTIAPLICDVFLISISSYHMKNILCKEEEEA